MNRYQYRVIFNKRLGTLVPVAEIAKTRSKGSAAAPNGSSPATRSAAAPCIGVLRLAMLAATLGLGGRAALAQPPLPSGGAITGGAGSIAENGSTLTVNQTSQNLAANWQSFDIGADHAVVFEQPNSSSVALNRVIGPDASSIYGS